MIEIEAAVDALVARLRADYPETMEVARHTEPNAPGIHWSIEPRSSSASPLWIRGEGWDDATVGFGRSSSRIELWQMGKTLPPQAEANLEKVCRSVLDGRLVEWRQDDGSCRYELTLQNGEVIRGMANALARRRWKTVERFAPYGRRLVG